MKNFIIFGASKGLGDASAKGLPENGDHVWIVSRGRPRSLDMNDGVHRYWIEADLSSHTSSEKIAAVLEGQIIDVLIYNDNVNNKQVTFVASKFGLRGIAHAYVNMQGNIV